MKQQFTGGRSIVPQRIVADASAGGSGGGGGGWDDANGDARRFRPQRRQGSRPRFSGHSGDAPVADAGVGNGTRRRMIRARKRHYRQAIRMLPQLRQYIFHLCSNHNINQLITTTTTTTTTTTKRNESSQWHLKHLDCIQRMTLRIQGRDGAGRQNATALRRQ